VIKQPDGKLAIFSSYSDSWACWDGSPEEVVDWFAERAAADARKSAQTVVNAVLADTPQTVYYQFALTFAEANAHSKSGGGEVLEGPVDPVLLAELERPLDAADSE
jgi:hypothetical protein